MGRTLYTINIRNEGINSPDFFITDSPYGKLAVYFDEPDRSGTANIGLYVSDDGKRLDVASVRPEEKHWIRHYFMKGYTEKWIALDWEQPTNTTTLEEALDRYVLAMIYAACGSTDGGSVTLSVLRERAGSDMSHETLTSSVSRLAENGRVYDDYTNSHRISPLSPTEGLERQMRDDYVKSLVIQRNPASHPVYLAVLKLWAAGEPSNAGAIMEEMGGNMAYSVMSGISFLKKKGMVTNVSSNPQKAVYAPSKAFIAPPKEKGRPKKPSNR